MENFYCAHFDGSTRPIDQRSTIGFIIYMPSGNILCKSHRVVDYAMYATSTEVEYKALIELLKALQGFGIKNVNIYGDCEAVIEEALGNKEPKGSRLALYEQVLNLATTFDNCSMDWVSRRHNRTANYLSRKSLGEMRKV
jgi:ribonuclease HI